MMHRDTCVALRLSDRNRLKQSELCLPVVKQNAEQLRLYLQQLRLLCGQRLWLVLRTLVDDETAGTHAQSSEPEKALPDAGAEASVVGLFGLQLIDPLSRRYRLHLHCSAAGPDEQLLGTVVHQAMNHATVYRLELDLVQTKSHWQQSLLNTGWRVEARLRNACYNDTTSLHDDVNLYALLRPEQPFVTVAYVPFGKAVLALVGDAQGLICTQFLRYGEPAGDSRIQESAAWFHLLDSQGCLPDRTSLTARLGGKDWICLPHAPEPLKQAAEEVVAYFKGSRRQIKTAVHMEQGSPFQQQVWKALADIPYGVTRTYEEIACTISGDTGPAARKMARAVGAACSANPIPLVLPCHRVIGKDGRLVGFSGGLDIKEYLLAHEIMGLG